MAISAARKKLGASIERLRDKLGGVTRPLSYGDVAVLLTKRLGRKPPIAGATILKWARGKGHPDPWALIQMARMAGVTVEEFVDGVAPAQNAAPPAEKRGQNVTNAGEDATRRETGA